MTFQHKSLKSKSLCEFVLQFRLAPPDAEVRERSLRLEIGPKDVGPHWLAADREGCRASLQVESRVKPPLGNESYSFSTGRVGVETSTEK